MRKIIIITFLTFVLAQAKSQEKSSNNCIEYLKKVKTDFYLNKDLMTDSIINTHQLFFIGETHGFQDNYTLAFKLIEEFKRKTNFEYILSEQDLATTIKLNCYISNADTLGLSKLIMNSKTSPSWCRERYEFYKKIIELNKRYKKKIHFLGIDITVGGIKPALMRIKEIKQKYHMSDIHLDSIIATPRMKRSNAFYIKQLLDNSSSLCFNDEDTFEYKYHLNNLLNFSKAINTSKWDLVRDSCMYENYQMLEDYYGLQNEKMIGSWGQTHAFQEKSENIKWLASRLKQNLGKNIYTYRIFYFDSKCMLPAKWIPGLLKVFRSKKKLYYNVKLQNDDNWVTGTKHGLDYLKEISPSETISFFDLEKSGSPYKKGKDLVTYILQNAVTTDYFQTAIVVRNSKPTEPFGRNRK